MDARLENINVRMQGDITEFLNEKKCDACQSSPDRKCLIKEDDVKCVSCTDAGQECIFRRPVIASGSPTSFKWSSLCELSVMRLEDFPLHRTLNGSAFQTANPSSRGSRQTFNISMEPILKRKRRAFANAEKERIKFIRSHGACLECKAKKRKCSHVPISKPTDHTAKTPSNEIVIEKNDMNDIGANDASNPIAERVVSKSPPSVKKALGQSLELSDKFLSPRVLPNPPVSQDIRVELVTLLYEQMNFLNDGIKKTQDASDEALALMDEDLVAEALDEELQVAENNPIAYQTVMNLKIKSLRGMEMEDWKQGRANKIAALCHLTKPDTINAAASSNVMGPTVQLVSGQAVDSQSKSELEKKIVYAGRNSSPSNDHIISTKIHWICNICYKFISTHRDLLRHKETQHKINDRGGRIQGFQCTVGGCPSIVKVFNRRDLFRAHLKRIHPQENPEELLQRSVRIVDSDPRPQLKGIDILLYSKDTKNYYDIRAKIDDSMSINIASSPVSDQLKVNCEPCEAIVKIDGKEIYPFGSTTLYWRMDWTSQPHPEMFYVVKSETPMVIFGKSALEKEGDSRKWNPLVL